MLLKVSVIAFVITIIINRIVINTITIYLLFSEFNASPN